MPENGILVGKFLENEADAAACAVLSSDVLWSSFFVTLLAKKYHYSIMQLPLLHVG